MGNWFSCSPAFEQWHHWWRWSVEQYSKLKCNFVFNLQVTKLNAFLILFPRLNLADTCAVQTRQVSNKMAAIFIFHFSSRKFQLELNALECFCFLIWTDNNFNHFWTILSLKTFLSCWNCAGLEKHFFICVFNLRINENVGKYCGLELLWYISYGFFIICLKYVEYYEKYAFSISWRSR